MPKPKYQRGDIVWVPFSYSDLSGGKARPALVVSTPDFSACQGDFILAAITGQVATHTGHPCCCELQELKGTGLAVPSVVTSHLITLSTSVMGTRAGKVSTGDLAQVTSCLRRAMDI